MNSTEAIRNYKHDITGKFRDISSVVNTLDESSFEDASNHEVFHAVHEVLLKMVTTSRKTIKEHLKVEMDLVISEERVDMSLGRIRIGDIVVRNNGSSYVYYLEENQGSVDFHMKVLNLFLPVSRQ